MTWGTRIGCACAALLSLVGCESKTPKAEAASLAKAPIVKACALNTQDPGPMRHPGKARVKIQGEGLALDAKDVPCVCGPMFNADTPKLGIKAGDGLFFETCLPHGSVQISAFERNLGAQTLHGFHEQGGAEVSFNRVSDSAYSSRGLATDKISFSDDFMRAKASVVLHDVRSERTFQAELEFDCTDTGS